MNFIKNIFEGNIDESIHRKFVRYSLGEFEKEEFTITVAGKNIKIQAGCEYVDVLFMFVASVIDEESEINGTIITKTKIEQDLNEFGIEPIKITGKKYTIKEKMDAARFKEFVDKFGKYYFLLKLKSANYVINVKKSIPKPGKVVEKFITVKLPKDKLDDIKKEFLFDHEGDFKKAVIKHKYIIDDVVVPKEFENDPEKARLNAKRKGKIIRTLDIDGNEEEKTVDMNV